MYCAPSITVNVIVNAVPASLNVRFPLMLYCCMQLRECLESEVYELFNKKLTEQALIKDPKFLWCCHVSTQVPLTTNLILIWNFS